jgi:hypothetical protein
VERGKERKEKEKEKRMDTIHVTRQESKQLRS